MSNYIETSKERVRMVAYLCCVKAKKGHSILGLVNLSVEEASKYAVVVQLVECLPSKQEVFASSSLVYRSTLYINAALGV